MYILSIAQIFTSRDLRVSKVSLEPMERREHGYVKWTSWCIKLEALLLWR